MISRYASNGQPQEAFRLFWCMVDESVRPNRYTLVKLLVACTERIQIGCSPGDSSYTYSRCGSLEDAIKLFGEMPRRSLTTWIFMITSSVCMGKGMKPFLGLKQWKKKQHR